MFVPQARLLDLSIVSFHSCIRLVVPAIARIRMLGDLVVLVDVDGENEAHRDMDSRNNVPFPILRVQSTSMIRISQMVREDGKM